MGTAEADDKEVETDDEGEACDHFTNETVPVDVPAAITSAEDAIPNRVLLLGYQFKQVI